MENLYKQIWDKIQEADAVLIGASNGLSISEGYNILADDDWFREHFGDFRDKYGIRSLLQGMFLDFEGPQEQWAYFSRLAYLKRYKEQPGSHFFRLITGKRRRRNTKILCRNFTVKSWLFWNLALAGAIR